MDHDKPSAHVHCQVKPLGMAELLGDQFMQQEPQGEQLFVALQGSAGDAPTDGDVPCAGCSTEASFSPFLLHSVALFLTPPPPLLTA